MQFLPKPGQARCVQIDIDPARIGLRYPVDVGLAGDARLVVRALLPMIEHKKNRKFLEKAQSRMQNWNHIIEKRGTRAGMPMKPQVVTHTLNRLLDDNAIIATDSGTITTWAARYIDMRGDMKFSLSGSLATMANALPYALAAAVAFPGRQCVCIVGDGGLTMLMGEIATLVKYKLNVKVIVIKNNALGQIKWEQMVENANPEFGVDLHPIDFAKFADAAGAAGYTIEDPRDCERVLRQALANGGPALVQAVVDPNEPPLPGNITTQQAMHFAEALVKGERDRTKIIKTILLDKVRETV
jgi:pyruvate dehydrogenase (quinone)